MYLDILRGAGIEESSKEEMVSFLIGFEERYPIRYVCTGGVLFVTIENKDELFAEITEDEKEKLRDISDAVFKATFGKTDPNAPKWSSDDVHAAMARKAAQNAGFSSSRVNRIAENAGRPDYWYSEYTEPYHSNYQHYYEPDFFLNMSLGGAPERIDHWYSEIGLMNNVTEKCKRLSYASHYMADLSMPLHTGCGSNQAHDFILYGIDPHTLYEGYISSNWTSGDNFSQYIQTTVTYTISDPKESGKDLAAYSSTYSDEIWDCAQKIENNSSYQLSQREKNITIWCLQEGQKYLNGLMKKGYRDIIGYGNEQTVNLASDLEKHRADEWTLRNLRVSMGAGDVARVYLNNKKLFEFVDTSAGGTLYAFDEDGDLLGYIYGVNGKMSCENITFDISIFNHNGSQRIVVIDRYHHGFYLDTHYCSFPAAGEMKSVKLNLSGYSNNVDYIDVQSNIIYCPTPVTENKTFSNKRNISYNVTKSHPLDIPYFVKNINLENLRVSTGAGDTAHIDINNRQILRFVDDYWGGKLHVYDESGNLLGTIDGANGKTTCENITFDVSFTHAVVYDMTADDTYGKMNIRIKRYQDGYFIDMYEYSYETVSETEKIYAEISGYQSGVDYISGKCRISYDSPVSPLPPDALSPIGILNILINYVNPFN